ncbi:UNVERIFIED_CONTAM: hypothetical protein FKN15_004125 [Acipenser sinensis]
MERVIEARETEMEGHRRERKQKESREDFSDGINIVQSPPSLFESPGRSAELNCSHDDSSYKQIYWYQQTNFSDGINIVQSPPSLFESPGRSAELSFQPAEGAVVCGLPYQQ